MKMASKESLTAILVPFETNIFDHLQQDPEVLIARKEVKGVFNYKHSNSFYSSFADLRHIYQKQRNNERMDIVSTKLSVVGWAGLVAKKSFDNIARIFASNTWIIGLILMVIDILFIFLYLAGTMTNTDPRNAGKCWISV
jgi:hypothetical protein